MTRERILASIALHLESVTTLQINRHISTALTKINEQGFNLAKRIAVVRLYDGSTEDPLDRVEGQAHNYYPTLKCFVLPSDLISLSSITVAEKKFSRVSLSTSLLGSGNMPYHSYALSETGEIYFSEDIPSGTIIAVLGTWSVRNLNILPARYENFIINHILS